MTQRYERQLPMIGEDGQSRLLSSCVAIIGCGGLGSSVITHLASVGVGRLILVDGDTVSESNLNRQYVHACSVGSSKVDSARAWVLRLNRSCVVETRDRFFVEGDGRLIEDADVVVDCLDDPSSRIVLADECLASGKVLVHAAVDGNHGQVAVIRPEGVLRMRHIYPRPSVVSEQVSISHSVSVIGSLEAKQVVDVILGSEDVLDDEILSVDLSSLTMSRVPIRDGRR